VLRVNLNLCRLSMLRRPLIAFSVIVNVGSRVLHTFAVIAFFVVAVWFVG
jgi:hypothetical protein